MKTGVDLMLGTARFLVLLIAVLCSPTYAAVLNIDSMDSLVGASGVAVGDALFDVEFVDDTCAVVYDVCAVSNFTFTTESEARAASQALIEQVFLDELFLELNITQAIPRVIAGCGAVGQCGVLTPFETEGEFLNLVGAVIQGGSDRLNFTALGELADFPISEVPGINGVFVRWTSSSVPDPAALPLLAVGLTGLAWFRRRKAQIQLAA